MTTHERKLNEEQAPPEISNRDRDDELVDLRICNPQISESGAEPERQVRKWDDTVVAPAKTETDI